MCKPGVSTITMDKRPSAIYTLPSLGDHMPTSLQALGGRGLSPLQYVALLSLLLVARRVTTYTVGLSEGFVTAGCCLLALWLFPLLDAGRLLILAGELRPQLPKVLHQVRRHCSLKFVLLSEFFDVARCLICSRSYRLRFPTCRKFFNTLQSLVRLLE